MSLAPFTLVLCLALPVAAASASDPDPAPSSATTPEPAAVEEVPGVDLSDFNDAAKERVKAILKTEDCPCGCNMNLMQCRHEDKTCPVSPELARKVADGVKAGRSDAEIRLALRAEDKVHVFELGRSPYRGEAAAPVTVVEFVDFQDSASALAESWMKEALATWPGKLRVVVKQRPSERRPQARFAAEAALAAHAQNRYYELHDRFLANYRLINPDTARGWATEAKLDLAAWERALASDTVKAAVDADIEEARKAGVVDTPALFVNGRHYRGKLDFASLKPVIEAALAASAAATRSPAR